MRAERPRTKPCAASWTGIQSSSSCRMRRCSAFSRGFGRSITRGGPARARQVHVAVVAQALVVAPRRSSPRTSANHSSSPTSSSEPRRELADRVDPRHRPARARTVCRVKDRLAQDPRRQPRRRRARRARSRRRPTARAGGPAAAGDRPAAPRRATVRSHARRPTARARPRRHRARLPLAREERGGAGTRPVSRERITTCDDAARRLSSCVRVAARNGSGAHAMRCSGHCVLPREPLETHLRGCGLGLASSRRGPYSDAVPEGDTIHYAANKIRPVLEGQVPDEIAHAAPALRARPLAASACEGQAVDERRRPRQAPVPALRGRAGDPLAPAHDRQVARARRATWPPPRNTWLLIRARREARGPDQRPGARADDRLAHPPGPADRRPRPGHPRARARRAGVPAAAARRTTRRARSATPCSTSGSSPASATCGRPRAASRPGSTPGGAPATSPTRRRWRSSTPRARGCRSPRAHGMQERFKVVYGIAGRPCPRCGDASNIRSRGQGDDNRTTYWCPRCQR